MTGKPSCCGTSCASSMGLPVLYIVGLVTVAVTEKNQRLGDLAAGTLVVRAG